MREIELRLAVVCFGGISLAVYIHGVTRELAGLVRASERIGAARQGRPQGRLDPVEQVYAGLLTDIGRDRPIRVVIDILSGASAGGVNAVTLARTLAHDLTLEPLRALWLDGADVDALTAERNRAGPFSKLVLRPLLPIARRLALGPSAAAEADFAEKLSRFLRARWFEPPFDGPGLAGRFFDALTAQTPADPHLVAAGVAPSLMPRGVPLDLIVTATDFHGHPRRVTVGDPAWVTERDHRHRLAFAYLHDGTDIRRDDFGPGSLPALAFAMRATSSFPGAFPPAHLAEIDEALAARGLGWPDRQRFVAGCFAAQARGGVDPEKIWLIDGAVLDNKPFGAAIERIPLHPATRPVDRRLIYVDPHPRDHPAPENGHLRAPGFLGAMKAAMTDIPRHEPIRDELEHIAEGNRRAIEIQDALSRTWRRIEARVHDVAGPALDAGSDAAAVAIAREAGHEAARADAGFTYDAYLRLKTGREIEALALLIARMSGMAGDEAAPLAGAARAELIPAVRALAERDGPVTFLRRFDAAFAGRRLRFLLRVVNMIADGSNPPPPDALAALKADLYALLARIERSAGGGGDAVPGLVDLSPDATATAVAEMLALIDATRALDARLAALDAGKGFGLIHRRRLIAAHVGFAWLDVLLLPLLDGAEQDPSQTVGVMRISPDDARLLAPGGAAATLKGIGMQHFGAFFSRAWRENDYLWGRLHGAERMVDLLVDAAAKAGVATPPDPVRAKCRLFRAILEMEAPHLPQAVDLIRDLRIRIDQIEDTRS